ncbi:uncharacterized protein LOC116239763 isoform X2 [Phasianus colchicus]|uniref:uncharacterized protein LOC116239763 isoform X2 n=1 Tax=Phasianus colchicus TaxID=9054 RepID=UPI00129E1B1C|nr:uncharacterized protein LOC116239763 isoform X2 [Phasianus colchicus]
MAALFIPVTLILLYGLMFLVAGIFLLTVIRNLRAGRRRLRWRRWWRRAVAPEPGAERQAAKHSSSQCKPWCPCSKANQELQQLVLSGLPGHRSVLDPDFWQAAWRDLEELVKQNSLSCHCCSSSEVRCCPRKGYDHSLTVPGSAPTEPVPVCTPGSTWSAGAHKSLSMHVAWKSLKVHLRALHEWLLFSQLQARKRQCCSVLPKLIKPGQTEPLLQHRLSPLLQAKGNCTAGNILKKQELKQWEGPNPTEISQNPLVPCLPTASASPEYGSFSESHFVLYFQGQAEAQGHPRKRQQHYQGQPKESAKIPLPLCSAPKETERPMARAALPGPAEAARLKDNSSQMGASDLRVADIKAISRQHHRAVPDNISKLQLSQVTCGKLSMHTDRKCLELKFQLLRTSARRPTELLQNLQPTQAEPVSAPKRMCLLHPDQDRRQQRGAKAPGSRLVPMYFYSCEARFLTEEERETLELHIRSMKLKHLGNSLISGHPLQSAASWEKESTSTYVTAPSEASWAEAGPKGHKWWSWWKK